MHRACARVAALVLAGLWSAGLYASDAKQLTVISFGRADQDALTKAYYDAFGQSTGIRIKSFSYDGQTTELEQMVRSGKPDWDVIQVESRTLQLGCEQGLFEKLDIGRIGQGSDFIPGAVSDCGVGIFAWSLALVYSDRLKATPNSWADFWDVKRYPGKRGLRRSAKYTLEIALLADGVAPTDVYPLLATDAGVQRAFRKLEQIKPHTIWWEAAAQPGAQLSAGNMVMSSAYTLWFDPEQPRNQHFKIAWDHSLYDVDSWAILKGSARLSEAYRFISFASTPERQKTLSEHVPYGPTNVKAWPLLADDLARSLPSSQANLSRALKIDTAFWIAHGEALEKRFDAWAPQICRQQTDDDEDDYVEQPVCQDVRGNLRVSTPDKTHSDAQREDKAHANGN
ncbi:MAG TPA: extracellular solute-binding protein [Burkholderiaceae bacterium]|jgi:putative spermidine/putrescine transport system substrate-binding protein|nr:extracellular solute-binding protein [Burkholderiaceae bacterium]